MQEIHIMSGPPASGKSTRAQELLIERPGLIHLSRDIVRANLREKMNTKEYFPVSSADEWKEWSGVINRALRQGHSIIIDQTTLGEGALIKLCKAIQFPRLCEVVIHVFATSLKECQWRNGHRTGFEYVPPKTLRDMHKGSFRSLSADRARKLLNAADCHPSRVTVFTYS